jgi:hypothetical protein
VHAADWFVANVHDVATLPDETHNTPSAESQIIEPAPLGVTFERGAAFGGYQLAVPTFIQAVAVMVAEATP